MSTRKITSTLALLAVLLVACSDSPPTAPIADGGLPAQEMSEWLRLLEELRVVDPIAAELLNLDPQREGPAAVLDLSEPRFEQIRSFIARHWGTKF